MKSLRFLDRRVGFSLGALSILLGAVAPAVVPAFASASQLTSRSIQMSDSTTSKTGVTYNIQFNPVTTDANESYVTIIFCDASTGSFEGAACTGSASPASAGITASAGSDTSATIDAKNSDAVVVETKLASTTDIVLTNMANPTTVGPFYARIETFSHTVLGSNAQTDAEAAEADPTAQTANITDFGGVALSATTAIGVSAYVEEQMNFCVSAQAPLDGCTSTNTPNITLGTQQGQQYILPTTGVPSPATVYAQMTTNAEGGAVVSMKSDANGCGGLYLKYQTTVCGIGPEKTASHTWTGGEGLFGMAVGSEACAQSGTCPTTGNTLAGFGSYNTTNNYYMGYDSGNATGVTSPYGDEILSTAGPIGNENIPLNFDADASPTTPAGQYQANLSLIATGSF